MKLLLSSLLPSHKTHTHDAVLFESNNLSQLSVPMRLGLCCTGGPSTSNCKDKGRRELGQALVWQSDWRETVAPLMLD